LSDAAVLQLFPPTAAKFTIKFDPAKVTRCALQNAASIAGLMLTTEALISELKEDNKHGAMSAGMGDGMGM